MVPFRAEAGTTAQPAVSKRMSMDRIETSVIR
jgi:hypothetical protein